MNKYKVLYGQNLFDIALYLYGDIEGIFDLLISNPWLTMNTILSPGTELLYHEDFILNSFMHKEIRDRQIIPCNEERHVYYKNIDLPIACIYKIQPESQSVSFIARGSGSMTIDWGDNSPLENVELTIKNTRFVHTFDNIVDSRVIKFYGEYKLTYWDTSDMPGMLYCIRPINVERYINHSNVYPLDGLFLFNNTYDINLSGSEVKSLLPIGRMSLEILDLRNVTYLDSMALAEYFNYIFEHYEDRRNCVVYMEIPKSWSEIEIQETMKPIDAILSNPDWNMEGNVWRFIINGNEYKTQK